MTRSSMRSYLDVPVETKKDSLYQWQSACERQYHRIYKDED